MLQQLIGNIIAHKAGIAIGGAIIGVAVTAVLASKDGIKHKDTKQKAEFKRDRELTDDEIAEMMEKQGFSDEEIEDFEVNDEIPDDFQYLNWKERAIIFFKSYWRTLLAMALTIGLMIFSHISMAKEMAAVTAALGVATTKYKELDAMLKEKFPDAHEKVHKFINEKNARREFSKNDLKKEETYDGRMKFYEPWSNQIFFAKESDVLEALDTTKERLINGGSATIYDFLCSLPPEVKVIKEDWMQHFGWFTGAIEESSYEYNIGLFGPYLKHKISEETIIVNGEKEVVHTIDFEISPDIEPDMPASIAMNTEIGLKKAADRNKAA